MIDYNFQWFDRFLDRSLTGPEVRTMPFKLFSKGFVDGILTGPEVRTMLDQNCLTFFPQTVLALRGSGGIKGL